MKLKYFLRDYFSFNRSEQRGIFILLLLILLVIIAQRLLPHILTEKSQDFTTFNREVLLFEAELKVNDSIENAERFNKYHKGRNNLVYQHDTNRSVTTRQKEMLRIDLNLADTFELQQLRGIGPSFARRIVRYRERLGGYVNKRQLLEVFGMDEERYKGIEEHLIIMSDPIKKINMNTVAFKELLAHPYFQFEITREIMLYRQKHKKIEGFDELRTLKGMNDSIIKKIRPYVRFR